MDGDAAIGGKQDAAAVLDEQSGAGSDVAEIVEYAHQEYSAGYREHGAGIGCDVQGESAGQDSDKYGYAPGQWHRTAMLLARVGVIHQSQSVS